MKKVLAILICAAMAFSLAGCSHFSSFLKLKRPDPDVVAMQEGLTAPQEEWLGDEPTEPELTTQDPFAYQENEDHELPRLPLP